MYSVRPPHDQVLSQLMTKHPYAVMDGESTENLQFSREDWQRQVSQGDPNAALYGLVELMDNNPLVCADAVSVPSPAATLALIAAGPAMRAGLPMDAIIFASTLPEPNDLGRAVQEFGAVECEWSQIGNSENGVEMISALIPIAVMDDWNEIDALYEEAYSRSFYVRLHQEGEWNPGDAAGRPYALLQLRLTIGEGEALLNAVAVADRHGKLGAAQLIHAFNVMCGFEESSGIPESLIP